MTAEIRHEDVSRETKDKLDVYYKELISWNARINLVSRVLTEKEIYNDHIYDSLQIGEYIGDKNASILDFGSGAGFPGIVLAIDGFSSCVLVELISKKCAFLRHIKSKLGLSVEIFEGDVKRCEVKANYIVSRAVTSLYDILSACQHIITQKTVLILHKSKEQLKVELKEIQKFWTYDLKEHRNRYKNEGVILEISNIRRL